MEKAMQANCNAILGDRWHGRGREVGFFEYIGKLAERYFYPEIRSNDYRMAEYIPPKADTGRN